MTSRIKQATLAGVFGLALLCLSAIFGLCIARTPYAVSISFLGYTNEQGQTAAMFRLTNGSNERIDFKGEVTGFRLNSQSPASPEPGAGFSGSLNSHDTCSFPLMGVENTNGWRYEAVFSATRPWPRWQQHMGLVLDRVGIHLYRNERDHLRVKIGGGTQGLFSSERLYHSTNSWTSK